MAFLSEKAFRDDRLANGNPVEREPRDRSTDCGNGLSDVDRSEATRVMVVKIGGEDFRTIWVSETGDAVCIIDQTKLPHRVVVAELKTLDDAVRAIADMLVRGAPLIGATAAFGIVLGMQVSPDDQALENACRQLLAARPTAVNLRWAVDRMRESLLPLSAAQRLESGWSAAQAIVEEDVEICRAIGEHGLSIIEAISADKNGEPVNILTHCNAGWLATIDWGTATSPIYQAHQKGIDLHVWVDETRPRYQGAALTAFELGQEGIAHTVITDNAGGNLMQQGRVDMCLVGTDRTTAAGDVCNKIGTYLKALAAKDCGVPFYVALPGPTIDWRLKNGRDIPIEERSADEVRWVAGRTPEGGIAMVDVVAEGSAISNPAFDVTPARLVTGLITERGIAEASEAGLGALYPETRA